VRAERASGDEWLRDTALVPRSDIELIRSAHEYFRSTGKTSADISAPGFVWDMSTFRGWPEQQVYEGVEGAERFLNEWRSAWEEWQLEAEEFLQACDKVVAVMRQTRPPRRRAECTWT